MPVINWGPTFTLSSTANIQISGTPFPSYGPSVATLPNGNIVVAWTEGTGSSRRATYQIFDPQGAAVTQPSTIVASSPSHATYQPSIGVLADGFVIAVTRDFANTGDEDIRGFRYGLNGALQVSDIIVANSGGVNETWSAVAGASTGFAVAYGVNDDIGLRIFDASGISIAAVSIASGANFQRGPDVIRLVNGNYVIAWSDRTDDFYKAQIVSNSGALVGGVFNLHPSAGLGLDYRPSLTPLANGGFVAAWHTDAPQFPDTQSYHMNYRIYQANGTAFTEERIANSTTAGLQARGDVVALADGFVVIWSSDTAGTYDLFGQRFDIYGQRQGGEFLVASGADRQSDPSLSLMSDGRIAVVYVDSNAASPGVKLQIIDPRDGSVIGSNNADTMYGHEILDDQISGRNGNDVLHGLGGNDQLIGGDGQDILIGGYGDDFLFGNAAGDALDAGDGNDNLFGGVGADALNGGAGWDAVRHDDAAAGVGARLYDSSLNTGEAAGDVYSGVEQLVGSYFSDALYGDGGNNIIAGLDGNDLMDGVGGALDQFFGGNGDDQVYARAGVDVIDGGVGFDYARYDNASSGVAAYLYDATQNTGFAAGDVYASVEALVGSAFADDLRGDANQNIFFGLDGADFIVGLGGGDAMTGGAGADTFFYATAFDGGAGGDAINDFVSGSDRLMVQGLQFLLGSPGGVPLEAFRFVAGASATAATVQFGYDAGTREVWYDSNGTGAGGRLTLAFLQVGATLTATDIIVL